MTETAVQPGQRRRRFGVLVILAILLLFGSCTGLDLWAGDQVETEIARFESRYGSLNEMTLFVPSVPPADNRARIVRAAAALTIPLYKRITLRAPAPVSEELRAFADANQPAIRLAGEIRTRQQSNWDVVWDRSKAEVELPLEGLWALSDAIYVTALLDLGAGRADEAAGTIISGLGVSASIRQEPASIAQLVRVGFASRQFEAIRQLVTQAEPSKAALADVARWLVENRMPDPMQTGLLGEVKQINALFRRMEHGEIDRNTATYIYPETWPSWGSAWLGPIARIGRPFVRLARARYLQQMGHLLDVQSGPRPRPESAEPPAPKRWALIDRLTAKFTAGTEGYSEVGDDFNGELAATELAVALRRFKLDRGAYPDDLSALVPAHLARLPIDPYTGQPPVYARQGAGFTLRARSSNPNAVEWLALDWRVPK